MVRDQFFTLLLDERRAIEAIQTMLDADPELTSRMGNILRRLIGVLGIESKLGKTRLAEIEAMLDARKKVRAPKNGAPKRDRLEAVGSVRSPAPAKAHRPH